MNHEMVDPELLEAFDVFKIGIRFDGVPVLSRDGRMPIDETIAFMADKVDEEMTVGEMSKLTDFEWIAEPVIYNPVQPKTRSAGVRYDSKAHVAELSGNEMLMQKTYLSNAAEFGKFSAVDYLDVSPFLSEGRQCSNCVFYVGVGVCKIVDVNCSPMGVCPYVIVDSNTGMQTPVSMEAGMRDLSDEDAFNNRMAMEAGMYKKRMGMYAGMHSGVYDTMDEEFQSRNNGTYSASYVGMDEDAFNNRMAMEAGMYSNVDDATYEDMYKKRVMMKDASMRRMSMQSAVMEPEVFDPLAGMPLPGTPAFDQVQEAVQLTDVEQIEIIQAIETAEDRIGQLEGLIAQSLLSTVTDNMFDGETAVVASAAFVASIGDSNSDEIFAKLAALPKDLPVDLMTRVESVIERLTAIEEQVSKMMLDDVSDEELPQGSGSDFVDETIVNADEPMGKKKLKP